MGNRSTNSSPQMFFFIVSFFLLLQLCVLDVTQMYTPVTSTNTPVRTLLFEHYVVRTLCKQVDSSLLI